MALWEEPCDSEMKMNWGLGQGIKSYWRRYEKVERWAVRRKVGYSLGGGPQIDHVNNSPLKLGHFGESKRTLFTVTSG